MPMQAFTCKHRGEELSAVLVLGKSTTEHVAVAVVEHEAAGRQRCAAAHPQHMPVRGKGIHTQGGWTPTGMTMAHTPRLELCTRASSPAGR